MLSSESSDDLPLAQRTGKIDYEWYLSCIVASYVAKRAFESFCRHEHVCSVHIQEVLSHHFTLRSMDALQVVKELLNSASRLHQLLPRCVKMPRVLCWLASTCGWVIQHRYTAFAALQILSNSKSFAASCVTNRIQRYANKRGSSEVKCVRAGGRKRDWGQGSGENRQ